MTPNTPSPAFSPRRRPWVRLGSVAVVGLSLLATACGSSNTSSPATTIAPSATTAAPASTAPPTTTASGPVDVLYAGSLADTMEKVVGPAFNTATGYTFTGTSGDSGSLANEIKAKTIQGDVYISANPSKDVGLEGAANGNWVSWYAQFATSPLVLGYNPNSKFATALKTEPWWQVIAQPGFLIGRTDPATDPKGVLAVTALTAAASAHSEPALTTLSTETSDVFPETSLVGRLQAGQLDAGFFYGVEAAAANIATVPLTGTSLAAKYTITILGNAPHAAAATAFVEYLLGSQGAAELGKEGLVIANPITVSGTAPSDLSGVLSGQ